MSIVTRFSIDDPGQRVRRHAALLHSPVLSRLSDTERRALAAVVTMMDSEWPDVTFAALLGEDKTEEDMEAIDPAYLLNLVAFHYVRRGRAITNAKEAIDLVGQMHEFPYTAHGLITLVRTYEASHGPIWTPEVRDA